MDSKSKLTGVKELDLVSKQTPKSLNILVVGIGGLGVVSLTQKLRNLIAQQYIHVHTIEQRGIAQRRSSTSALITASDRFVAPSSPHAEIDLLLALEPLEALRHVHLLTRNAHCLISDFRVETLCGSVHKYAYSDILASIKKRGACCSTLPSSQWLKNEKMLPVHVSIAMLGMVSAVLKLHSQSIFDSFKDTSFNQKNRKAFQWGFNQYNPQSNSNNISILTAEKVTKAIALQHKPILAIESAA